MTKSPKILSADYTFNKIHNKMLMSTACRCKIAKMKNANAKITKVYHIMEFCFVTTML